MAEPTFTYDPNTLREVAHDPEAARTFADGVLAHYRSCSDDPREQGQITPVLIQWLRISGQTSRAEEVARTAFIRTGGALALDSLENGESAWFTPTLDQIPAALRLATALHWNDELDESKSALAAQIFDGCVQFLTRLLDASDAPDPHHQQLLAFALQHRGKLRLQLEDFFGALRDSNLGLSLRIESNAPTDQVSSSQYAVNSIVHLIERDIEEHVNRAGATIETETFAAGDRSGYGAVNGKSRIGPWLFWFKSGRIKAAGEYRNDQLHGPWIWFREQGGLLQEGSFEENLQEGHWVRYHPNGRVLDQGEFLHGQKVGRWEHYSADGRLTKTINHKIKKRK